MDNETSAIKWTNDISFREIAKKAIINLYEMSKCYEKSTDIAEQEHYRRLCETMVGFMMDYLNIIP